MNVWEMLCICVSEIAFTRSNSHCLPHFTFAHFSGCEMLKLCLTVVTMRVFWKVHGCYFDLSSEGCNAEGRSCEICLRVKLCMYFSVVCWLSFIFAPD